MSSIKEKVSYLKGIMEAYAIAKYPDKKENKIYTAIVGVLDEIALEIDDMKDQQGDLEEYVEKIDEDLSVLEESMLDDEDEEFEEVECPHCGEIFDIEEAYTEDSDELVCPICKQKFDLEL